jgi:hypothetical protein
MEDTLQLILCDYFVPNEDRALVFYDIMLRRDGLTLQNKIEIVRALIDRRSDIDLVTKAQVRDALRRVEEFKAIRNALAHGRDVGGEGLSLEIEIVGRSGNPKKVVVSPTSHNAELAKAEALVAELDGLRARLNVQPS